MRHLLLLAAVLFADPEPKTDDNAKDQKAMQGDWACDSAVRDGMTLPADDAQSFFRTVKDNHYTVSLFNKKIASGKFTLDAGKKVREIDLTPDPPFKGKPIPGIYKIEKDKLTMCYSTPGGKRPTEFKSEEGTGVTVMVWIREKR